MRHAALIYNPKAGRQHHARSLDAILRTLRDGGVEVEPTPTGFAGEATTLARERAAAGAETILAFGGDGTVREVAAGLLGSSTALGILPGGTVNLLSRALGLPRDPVEAAGQLPRLRPRRLDVGLAGGEPFLMMVSAGLDASLLAALDVRLKWRFGRAAIAWQGLREWWRYPYPRLEIEAGGETLAGSFVAVSNIPDYGGVFILAPGARPSDGWLDLVLFHGSGRRQTFSLILDLLRGAHVRRRDVTVCPVREVVLRSPAGALVQIDGDLCQERLPLAVRIAPEPLFVLAPETPPT